MQKKVYSDCKCAQYQYTDGPKRGYGMGNLKQMASPISFSIFIRIVELH